MNPAQEELDVCGQLPSCLGCHPQLAAECVSHCNFGFSGFGKAWRHLLLAIFGYSAGGAIQRSVPEFPGRQVDVKIGQDQEGLHWSLRFHVPWP